MLQNIQPKDSQYLFATPIVQQTAYWSTVKTRLGNPTLAVNFKVRHADLHADNLGNTSTESDILVTVQRIDNCHSIAYVPYGPEIEPDEEVRGVFLEELSEVLREFLPNDCIMIRYDLHWESFWAHDQEGDAAPMEPSVASQEMRLNFNTVNWNFRKPHHNILPTNTIFVDLADEPELILARMKPKTRYNIGLSQRKGVQVRFLRPDEIHIWYNLYRETAQRNNLYVNDLSYFETVLTTNAGQSSSPAEVFLMLAEHEGEPLAAMFQTITSHRSSYLYGASSSEKRNLMAPYALQWQAIQNARAKGCTEYDMFGISPGPDPTHPMFGLYQFKSGFGGQIYRSMGCWDYPLNEDKYQVFKSLEMNSQGFHNN